MEIKITLFITMLIYAFVISQSFFYILAMSGTMKKMQAATYIEISSILLTAFCVVNPSGLLFFSSVIALIALVADVLSAIKGNIPLNNFINSWTTINYPEDWKRYRSKWFTLYNVRQALNITGFVSLLAGLIFGM